jgi:hypothetical protein
VLLKIISTIILFIFITIYIYTGLVKKSYEDIEFFIYTMFILVLVFVVITIWVVKLK